MRLSTMKHGGTAKAVPYVLKRALALTILIGLTTFRIGAVTRTNSADGQFWDVQDTSAWSQDSGGIATGGRILPSVGAAHREFQIQSMMCDRLRQDSDYAA